MEYTNKGMEAYEAKEYQTAVEALSASYETDPSNDKVLYYLASAYRSLGDSDKATELYSALVNKFPESEFVDQAKGYLRNGAEDENAVNNDANAQPAAAPADAAAVPAPEGAVPEATQTEADVLAALMQQQ
jgi:tetratricopeptide (TPR) repeat protein